MNHFLLQSHHREHMRPIARHEAGHYIAAKKLGFEVDSMAIHLPINGGHYAHAEIILQKHLPEVSHVIEYCENRIQVLFAGALAESLNGSKIDIDAALNVLKGGGMSDHQKARELMRLVANIKYPAATTEAEMLDYLNEIDGCLWNKAALLIESESEVITVLGDRLLSELTHYGKEFVLPKSQIDEMQIIKDRFLLPK